MAEWGVLYQQAIFNHNKKLAPSDAAFHFRLSFGDAMICFMIRARTMEYSIPKKVVEGDGSKLDLQLSEMGYRHYGIFANDPGALELFDEIDRQQKGEGHAESVSTEVEHRQD
jgi:hypothetical protein